MVIRVWGKADRLELVFSNLGNDNWVASVPADLEDGQYVVELYCEDDGGNRAFWTGILYLSNSENASIRIVADKFKVWMVNEKVPETQEELKTSLVSDDNGLDLQPESNAWLIRDAIVIAVSCMNHIERR